GVPSTASAALGIRSKEGGVVVPLLLATDLPDTRAGSAERRAILRTTGAATALSASYLVALPLFYPLSAAPLALTPRQGLVTLAGYVGRLLWPWPQTFYVNPLEK